jgi:hypothetical protein
MNLEESDVNKQTKIESLISELKIYKTVNHSLHTKINSLESQAHTNLSNLSALEQKLQKANLKIDFLEKEKKILVKKYANKIDILQKEIKRNDIFNKKIIGTSKTKNESYMIQEMDTLRHVNKTLLRFVDVLSEKFGFDSEISKSLCEIAESVEDNILQLFIQDIEFKLKRKDKKVVEDIKIE